jgi:pimeloyl-ACP methyl ester carboxylesterase
MSTPNTALTPAAVRHGRPPASLVVAILTIVVGIMAAAIGLGVGLPHLAKGERLTGVMGLLALIVGLVLIVLGMVTLARRLHGRTRLAVVALAILPVLVLTYSLSIALAVTNVPRTAVGDALPSDDGVRFDDVRLPTSDGVTLSGWYIPSTNTAAVVLLHGAGSTRSNVLEHAIVLARHGYGALLVDARGHGRSGGRAMDFGWYGDLDVDAAVDFLLRQPDVDPDRVAVVGLSMGGEQAVGAAAHDRRIQAVVGEGVTGRTADDKAWMVDVYGARGWIQQRIDDVTYGLTDLLTPADPPISLHEAVAAAAPMPLLLITAGARADEATVAQRLQTAAPATVDIWNVVDAQHADAFGAQPDEWERRVTDFLARALQD